MATVNFFENAKTVAPSPKASLKKAAQKVKIEGLEMLARIDLIVSSLKGVRETYYAEARRQASDEFIANGCAAKKRPGNFKAEDGNTVASIELRRRGANRPLNEEAVAILREHNVTLEETTTAPDTFIVNPAHLEWLAKNAGKVNKALSGIKDCPPDLFQKQEGVRSTLVCDSSVDEVFRLGGDLCGTLLPLVTDISVGKFVLSEEEAFEKSLKVILKEIKAKGNGDAA